MVWIVIVASVLVVIGVVVWFTITRQHPESASSHAGEPAGVDSVGRGTGSPDVADRPGGPDAENMSADPPGGFTRPGRLPPPAETDQ